MVDGKSELKGLVNMRYLLLTFLLLSMPFFSSIPGDYPGAAGTLHTYNVTSAAAEIQLVNVELTSVNVKSFCTAHR